MRRAGSCAFRPKRLEDVTVSSPLQLTFVESASRAHTLPASPVEVAFVGRSNVGKSSLINALANRKQLARVSNTPGRTQLINLFRLDKGQMRRAAGNEKGKTAFCSQNLIIAN